MKEGKKEEVKRQRRCSPVEGLLVLLDLAARQLVELGVHVYELVLLLHLLALLELVVDPLSPAEQATEFGVRWHDPLSIFSIRIHVDEGERKEFRVESTELCGDALRSARHAVAVSSQTRVNERERESERLSGWPRNIPPRRNNPHAAARPHVLTRRRA